MSRDRSFALFGGGLFGIFMTIFCTIFIVSIVGVVGGYYMMWKGGWWIWSQQVEDIEVIQFLEEDGWTNVRMIESFRTDPQDDLGCVSADHAGFILTATNERGNEDELTACCHGGWGEVITTCVIAPTN